MRWIAIAAALLLGWTGAAHAQTNDAAGRWAARSNARPGETVIACDPAARYAIDQHWPTNPKLTAIFEADQKAREDWAHADPSAVATSDAARREQVKTLLAAGALHSGEDFYHAAFVFQHGMEPNDYLLAHALAVIAAERGKAGAAWIAAATLDRYLQAIGKPQIYGTQFTIKRKVTDGNAGGADGVTQEPYDSALLSDALRTATGVPTIAEQKARAAELEAQFAGPTE